MLLYEVIRNSLDPGYEAAARERGHRERSRSQRLATLFTAVLLAFVSVTAVRHLRAPEPEALRLRRSLEEQIDKRSAVVETRQQANGALLQAIAVRRDKELTRRGAADLAERVERMGVASGDVPVLGPGGELTQYDAEPAGDEAVGGDPRQDVGIVSGDVADRDLQIMVNGLWVAGAEAISVNGQRLTALSAIRSAGQAILVDYRPLVPPYVIRAIGDPAELQAGFAADLAGSYLQTLRNNYGITSTMDVRDRMTVPGGGELSLRWARPQTPLVPGLSLGTTGTGGADVTGASTDPTHSATDTEVSP
jgi:uncharacterized protein YlxW (UPF0749 family)